MNQSCLAMAIWLHRFAMKQSSSPIVLHGRGDFASPRWAVPCISDYEMETLPKHWFLNTHVGELSRVW